MKIALVHDFLTQQGGAENVLEAIHEMYPESPIFVLFHDPDKMGGRFKDCDIRTSFLQKIPGALKHYQWYLALMPAATEHLDLSGYDIVISSSSAFANGVITSPNTLHICYCHTPTRYLWTDTHEYVSSLKYNGLVKKFIPLVLNRLRMWDRIAAERVDKFVANSKTVQKRIKKYYNRTSDILYPPVETSKFTISDSVGDYYITGGRLVPYKRFDLTIRAFNKIKKPLKIFGVGPEYEKLKNLAGPTVEILGRVSETELLDLYKNAQAFIHPQEEDLGITPIESMASGRPIIGYAKGGLLETMIHNKTGIFFKEQTEESLIHAVRIFENQKFDPTQIREHALNFSKEKFKKEFKEYIDNAWEEFQNDN